MSSEYEECIQKGKIKPFSRGRSLVSKEMETSLADLKSAEKTFADGNYKWATIQVYYAMFHAARALLYSNNMRERSHYCLVVAIKELFVDKKLVPPSLLEALKEAKSLREDADYYDRWSQAGCSRLLVDARELLAIARKIVIP
ncbi:MAG: HEPN domain-containing protein [Chloroflexi bacterium]|nr:HEPN domain-containing protein [Chloroflexota bacterium]